VIASIVARDYNYCTSGASYGFSMTTIHLAHSPDSDDAFMFYALAAGKIDTDGINYVHELQDIESLNQRARNGELEVTAVSIHAYSYIADKYALLTTTAYLALKLYEPDFIAVDTPFDQIEDRVIAGDVDAGLLIHEGQLTYADNGLTLVADMGEWWFQETGLPLPLGGNVVRRDLGDDLTKKISRHLRASIAYGLEHRTAALDHSMQYARGLDRSKADEFVGMYVNDWTLDYGDRGRLAVRTLLDRGVKAGIITREVDVQFVDDQ
jgi:1,4-dihydroxy-6-naphthoate synthase